MNLFPCRLPGEETTISVKSFIHRHMSADTVWTFVNPILRVTLNSSFTEGGWYLLTVMRREAHVTFQLLRDWLTLWPYSVFVPALAPRCLLVRKHGQPLPCHQEPQHWNLRWWAWWWAGGSLCLVLNYPYLTLTSLWKCIKCSSWNHVKTPGSPLIFK